MVTFSYLVNGEWVEVKNASHIQTVEVLSEVCKSDTIILIGAGGRASFEVDVDLIRQSDLGTLREALESINPRNPEQPKNKVRNHSYPWYKKIK
jgi:hypothetical protein